MKNLVVFLKERFISTQLLLAHIGRITDNNIKARLPKRLSLAIKEDVGKFEFPVEEMLFVCQRYCFR